MTHAWCRDPSRDERVRAAEEGRTGPLPTLGEAIAAVTESMSGNARGEEMSQGNFADAAERSSTVSETVEAQSGLRTERVTLEITHNAAGYPLSGWDWRGILSSADYNRAVCESVRVVEEAHFDDLAQVAMERDAAIREREKLRGEITSVLDRAEQARSEHDALRARVAELQAASGGGEAQGVSAGTSSASACDSGQGSRLVAASGGGEAVAWGVMSSADPPHRVGLHWDQELAERWARQKLSGYTTQLVVVPLYREPPQPRGWLTASERQNLEEIVVCLDDDNWQHSAAFVRSLLARSTPPEVVLDALPTDETGECFSRRDVIKALAAAGVAVKEVG